MLENLQLLPNKTHTQTNLPTHEMVNLSEYEFYWVKVVDFLTSFLFPVFFGSVSNVYKFFENVFSCINLIF